MAEISMMNISEYETYHQFVTTLTPHAPLQNLIMHPSKHSLDIKHDVSWI